MRQSRAAADQTKINGILLELRILTQRCLTEQQQQQQQEGSDGGLLDRGGNDIDRVKQEVDVLLENLLVARRDLMGHQLHGGGVEENKDVDYAKLIKQADKSGDGPSSSSGESSTNGDSEGDVVGLAALLQNEYTSLQTHWKSILNKHHSNLALHSGMSVNNSNSKAGQWTYHFGSRFGESWSTNNSNGARRPLLGSLRRGVPATLSRSTIRNCTNKC